MRGRATTRGMRGLGSFRNSVCVLVLMLGMAPGCASWVALRMSGPSQDDQIKMDMDRGAVEDTLRVSPTSVFKNDGMTEARYVYADGPSTWSKARVVIYVAADVFTLFLSELIFWPIELYSNAQIQRIAVAEYSANNKLAKWTVRRREGGEPLHTGLSLNYDQYAQQAREGLMPIGAYATSTPRPTRDNAGLPMAILAPSTVSTDRESVEFHVALADPTRHQKLLVNGTLAEPTSEGIYTIRQLVPVGPSTITLVAMDREGQGVTRRVLVTRSRENFQDALPLALGDYYALVIGNDNYSVLPRLRTARADATAIAEVLERKYGYEVEVLLDSSRSETVSALARWRKRLGPKDNLIIYYAGHGIREELEDHGYWMPVDADPDDPTNWIANASITRQLKAMDAKHVMVISDSCYSGTFTRGIAVPDRTPGYLHRLSSRRSRTALTSGGIEPVADSGSGGNSVFARALLDELSANDGLIEASELFMRIRRRVALNSDQTPQYAPIVKAGHEDGDFLFKSQ